MNSVLPMVRGGDAHDASLKAEVFLLHRESDAPQPLESAAQTLDAKVVSVSSVDDLLRRCRADGWGCVVVDYRGFHKELAGQLRAFVEQYPGYPVIVWSSQLEIPISVEAMKSGAIDILRKPLDNGALPGVLKGALHLAAQKLEGSIEARNLARRYESLPHSEKAVLALIMKGRTNKEVSHELDCSLRTVEAKRQRVLRAMQAENALELAAILSRHGLMDKALEAQTSPKSEDRVAKESTVESRVVAKPAPMTSAPHWGERVSQVS